MGLFKNKKQSEITKSLDIPRITGYNGILYSSGTIDSNLLEDHWRRMCCKQQEETNNLSNELNKAKKDIQKWKDISVDMNKKCGDLRKSIYKAYNDGKLTIDQFRLCHGYTEISPSKEWKHVRNEVIVRDNSWDFLSEVQLKIDQRILRGDHDQQEVSNYKNKPEDSQMEIMDNRKKVDNSAQFQFIKGGMPFETLYTKEIYFKFKNAMTNTFASVERHSFNSMNAKTGELRYFNYDCLVIPLDMQHIIIGELDLSKENCL